MTDLDENVADDPSNEPANEPSERRFRMAPRIEEQRLLEIATDVISKSGHTNPHIAAISIGRGQAAESIARAFPQSHCILWYIDQYHALRAQEHVGLKSQTNAEGQVEVVDTELPPNLAIECLADLPDRKFDYALLPLSSSGEQELARDYLQQMVQHLNVGGTLIVSVDNPKDRWLLELLKQYEKSIRVRPFDDAMVYMIEKSAELKKLKDFSCELAYRDCDELVHLVTRPGVFSHRQLDNGARQLLDAVDVYPEARLLDIGCGSGSVALGLAKRDPSAKVHAVDSNARALWCLAEGIKRNKLSNITMELNASGMFGEPEQYDMALANPPYFGDFLIAEKFITAAHRSLRTGGRLVLVTKQPNWYSENLPRWFNDCEVFQSRRYYVASGIK